ncbi:MAG: Hpt domain-containing protein [Lachnospiraceae bacterium]|nr:Hpt domain-containing protein [Lachnospiraceae bacterium]
MITIEALKEFGTDTDTGLKRVMGKEELYLRLVKTIPQNEGFAKLEEALENNDLNSAFEAAHGLKGVLCNLELSPLSDRVVEITEHLRAKDDADYRSMMEEILKLKDRLEQICNS